MRRPAVIFALFSVVYLAVLSAGWFQEGGTGGELLGHAAKIDAILALLQSGHFAWFPDYLTGAPAASLMSFALSIPVYAPALILVSDPVVAMKATGLILVALGGFAAFAFGRRLDRSGWSGLAVGCAFLLSPQILMRLGWQEHMTIVTAIPLVPLTFLAMLRVAERGTAWDALLLAISYSAALLAWSKMGATLAIPLGLFAVWLFFSRSECRGNLIRGAMWSIPFTLVLSVIPLLPLLRERGFMTVFELDQFDTWQAAYSAKAALGWFDRGGDLFKVIPSATYNLDRGAYYLGFVGLLATCWTIARHWRTPRLDRRTAAIRFFAFAALLMFWISLGPRTVLQGHMELLGVADTLPDFTIPLHWLLLAAQGLFIYWCLPQGRWRLYLFLLAFGTYLFLPLFQILEHIPLFADLRAPDSFWILNGTFAWTVAAALSVVACVDSLSRPVLKPILAAVALAVAALDFSPYFESFFKGSLPDSTFSQYAKAGDYLSQGRGRVLVVTGRYFPLDLPLRAERPLSTESLNHYLMPKDTARMQTASRISATDILTYMRLSGIGSLLIDRNDPDVRKGHSERWFRSLLPVSFENDDFVVLDNPKSLHPAFFGQSFAPAEDGYQEYVDALEIGANHHLTVAGFEETPNASLPGYKTMVQARDSIAPEFVVLEESAPRTATKVSLKTSGKPGWVVLSESWHPDWRVYVDGEHRAIFRGAGGFPAVPVSADDKVVEFRFTPPAWYPACLWTGASGWMLGLLGLIVIPIFPATRKRFATPLPQIVSSPVVAIDRPPIERPLVIIPTYNESQTIASILDAVLMAEPSVEVLVVDDQSPDGTADIIRSHAEFGRRVHLLARSGKLGLGSAYREGFRWAIDRSHDACLEIDADFSHDPADIPRLLAALNAGADAAIGSRYLDGVRVINWPEHRLILSSGASRFVRLATGLPLTDATSGFKALRTPALERIDWSQLKADGYGFQVELHWLLWNAGCRIEEIPIVFTERRAGQTKMSAAIAIEAARRVLQLALRNPSRGHQEDTRE